MSVERHFLSTFDTNNMDDSSLDIVIQSGNFEQIQYIIKSNTNKSYLKNNEKYNILTCNYEFQTYLNQFNNYEEWLSDINKSERGKLENIFPKIYHDSIFNTNCNLENQTSSLFINFSISNLLLGNFINNIKNKELYIQSYTQPLYYIDGHTFSFQDIINYINIR